MKSSLSLLSFVAVALLAFSTAAAPEAPKEEAIKKDRKQIEGTWRVISIETDGSKEMDDDAQKLTVENGSDGTWTLYSEGEQVAKGTSTIDPTKTPKTIDLTATEGDEKGKRYPGIYELGENTRKLCIAPSGQKRPKEFASHPGSEDISVTLERTKTKK